MLASNPLIQVTPGLMIWTIVCFLITFFVLKKYAFGPIQKTIDARRERIQSAVDEADNARDEARRLVDPLAVQRVVGGEPNALVVPRGLRIPLLGELDPEDRGVLARHDLELGVLLDALGVNAVESVGDVGFAGLQHQGAGGGFGDAAHDQRLDARHAPPILGKRLQHHFDARLGTDELVGPGADRVFLEALVADLAEVFFRDDDPGGGGGRAVERHEVGPRRLQMEAHHLGIDDFDLADVIFEGRRSGALVALEAELDVLGRHRVAVVERQPRAQLKFVGQPVLALSP